MDLAGMKRRELQALCKRHGLPAGGSNADLVARLDAALSEAAGAEEEEVLAGVAARKGCLKQTGGDAAEAKKVTFAAEEGKARRLRSRVIWSPIVAKTRGKSAQASTASAAAAAAAEDSISAEVGANVLVRRSRRNSVSVAEAEEVGAAVSVDRKRKRKNQDNGEGVAISAQVGVSSRVTRRSSLAGAAAVLPPAVEKKRGRGKAAGGSSKLAAEAQDCEPDVQNSAQVDGPARITRSRSVAPVVTSPTVVENKRRRKTGDAQTNVELPMVSDVPRNDAPVTRSLRNRVVQVNNSMVDETHTTRAVVENKRRRKTRDTRTNVELPMVSDVPRNDAPVTRSLRNRVVQVNNSMMDETHTARQLENKTQPSRPLTRRHQQVSSSVVDKSQEQIAAPNKASLLRRSGRNYSEDAEKQPAVKEVAKRSTRKSVALATLEKEENDLIEEKNPEARVRRSMRKSTVSVKDIKGIGEEIQDANSENVAKQPATEGPVRGSRRKSVVSELHEKEKGLTAIKNMEAHEGKSMRKPVMPVKDIKAVGEGVRNAKGKDVEKQFVVKQPTRRSSRKSVLPHMLENNSGLLAEEMNAEMNVRRSTRKSVLPNMLNQNQDHSKMFRKENFQSGKCQDDERQQKVKEPIRRSRRSVAAVLLEGQSNGIHEEKMSKNPMRRSTRKSVTLNEVEVEKVTIYHTEIVAQEPERVGEQGLKLRKHRRSSLEISSSANDSWRKQQNAQIPNEKDNTDGTQQASNSTTSKGRSSKRRRTTAPEEVMSVKEANDDIIISEATKDAYKVTHEYNKVSSSEVQEICQVNATREEFSSGPLFVTVGLTDEICTARSVPVVIPGSESGDNATESSDKSKQPQEHSNSQAVISHLSETRRGKLDQSTCIAGLVPQNCVVSEDKALMSEGDVNIGDGLSIDFIVGNREEQSPVSGEGRVGLEANASEPVEKNLADVMPTGLHAKSLQHDINMIAEETDKDVLPMASPIEECGEKYAVSVGWEASACESAGKPITGIFSNDLHPKHMHHDCDVLTKETGEASGAAPTMSESDTNPEIQCNAEESIRAADLGKCPSRGSKGNLYSTCLHLEGAADDCILPVLNADKGCSSHGRPSSFGLELLFAEAHKESYSKNIEKTTVEIDGGNKPSTPVTPGFCVGSVCLEDEDVQPTGCDAHKNLDVDQGLVGEDNTAVEIDGGNKPSTPVTPGFYVGSYCLEDVTEDALAQGKCNDQHVPAETNPKMKLNDELGPGMESGCSITEKNERFVADNLDEEAIIQVQQGDVKEGDLEKPSLCSASPESKHECGLPDENTAVEIDGRSKPKAPLTPGFYVGSDFLEDENVQPTECDADKKLDVDHSVAGEDIDVTRGFYVGSDRLEDEEVQPTRCDADKKLDVDQGVVEEEVLAQEKCNGQHVPAKTDLKTKLNDELAADELTESGCSITEKDERLVADKLDQEGDLEKPSLCSATPKCKHECGLPEETVLPSKNMGSLPSAEQSPFGLESLFLQESIDELVGHGAVASATAHTENGFDDSKDCHVKSALENALVSEPFSHHDTKGSISKNVDCMHPSQQDNGMEGLTEANPDEEQVLFVSSLDAKHIKEGINSEEVASAGEGSKELLQSEDLRASSEKTDVNGTEPTADGKAYGISDVLLSSALHIPADGNYEICLGSHTDVPRHVHNDRCSDGKEERFASKPWTNDIIEDASAKYIASGVEFPDKQRSNLKGGQLNSKLEGTKVVESGLYFNKDIGNILDSRSVGEITPSGSGLSKDSSVEYRQEVFDGFSMEASLDGSSTCGKQNVCRIDAIENPSISTTPGYKHEGALSEEAVCTTKNYAGTCSSNPRELIVELQSLFSKENIKEPDPHDSIAFPCAENSADESIIVEQWYKIHHGSNLSQSDLLDEPIGCSNTEVLRQYHNHKDQSNEDRVEQVVSEPCTNDIAEAAAANYIESGVVLLPSEERSNLNDGQLNPKLESPNIMGTCLNCDKDVRNTSDNGSVLDVVGKTTPSGSGLPEDYPKDHYPQQELLDGFSVESPQGNMFGKKIVSGVAGIGIPSLSLATPDNKHEDALSEEAVCTTKNNTGKCSVDPRHVLMKLQSLCSEDSTEKSDLQDNLPFPCADRVRDEPIICHVEKLVDTHASSEPDTCQGPCQDLGRHEEKESCMSLPMQAKESGGLLRSSDMKGSVTSAQIDLADDAHLIERDTVAAKQVFCEEKEETKPMPTSDSDALHEKSYSNGHADQAACASETQFYDSQKASIFDGLHLGPNSLQLESLDALDNDILYVNTGVLEQHHKEGYYEHNVYQVTSGICAMSEAAPVKVLETGINLQTPSLPDEQLNPELDGDEAEKHSLNCETDTSRILGTGSVMSKTGLLPKDDPTIYCQELELPNDLSSFEFAEGSAICQDESVSRSGICQPHSQKHIVAVNSRLSSCDTELLHQDHKEECDEPNEDKFSPKALVENNMSEEGPVEGMESAIMLPSEAGMSEMADELLNTKMSDESEEVGFSCDKDTIENFCTGSAKKDLYPLPKDSHIDSCQKQEVPEVLSLPGSGPCQQYVNESSSVQATYNIDVFNQGHEEYNQNNEDQITSGIPASSVPDAVEIEVEQLEMEIGPISATETSALPMPDEQPNSKLEGNEDQITPGIPASSVPEAVEIEQSEMEDLIPAAETSVLPVPHEQPNSKMDSNEVDERSCSYDKDFSIIFDNESLKGEASSLHKDDCMDLSSEDNHPNDLPAPRSPEQSAYFQNDNDSGSVGICQSSRRRGIAELRAKLQSFKVSSTVKGSYIAMSAPRPKSGDSTSQSAIALLRNIENTTAVKAGHPIKPNADGKDSSRRALQPISGRPREH